MLPSNFVSINDRAICLLVADGNDGEMRRGIGRNINIWRKWRSYRENQSSLKCRIFAHFSYSTHWLIQSNGMYVFVAPSKRIRRIKHSKRKQMIDKFQRNIIIISSPSLFNHNWNKHCHISYIPTHFSHFVAATAKKIIKRCGLFFGVCCVLPCKQNLLILRCMNKSQQYWMSYNL